MKATRAGKYIAVAGLTSMLLASPALAQDPDCSAASRQYGPNCDETEVTVFDPTMPPEVPGQPPVDDIDGNGGTVISIDGDLVTIPPGDTADVADSVAVPVYENGYPESADDSYPSGTATTGSGSTAGAAATLPDTGGAGWLVAGIGAALVSLALISRKIFLRS